jgi:hypothetical protein
MGAVTYPAPEVESALAEFVALRLETTAWQPAYAEILQRTPPSWNPTFVVTDHGGREVRRWTGFEPPDAFVGELELAHAAIDRLHGRADAAAERLDRLARAGGPASAEALYWLGAARYNQSGDNRSLIEPWDELTRRYPDTIWAQRADCLEPIRD